MFYKIKDKYYSIKNGISNIIKWIPTIWKIRDWDAEYLYVLIYKHLSHVEDCLRYNGHGVNSIKNADRIRIAKNLARRLYEQEYTSNALIPVEEKYGELKIRIEKDDILPMCNKVIFDESSEERKARSKAYEHAEYMEKQDRKMLFVMLDKYMDKWWDQVSIKSPFDMKGVFYKDLERAIMTVINESNEDTRYLDTLDTIDELIQYLREYDDMIVNI